MLTGTGVVGGNRELRDVGGEVRSNGFNWARLGGECEISGAELTIDVALVNEVEAK